MFVDEVLIQVKSGAGGDGCVEQIAGGNQHAFVLGQATQEKVARASRAQSVRSRQRLAMALHLVCAVELRAQRKLGGGLRPAQRRRRDQGFGGSDRAMRLFRLPSRDSCSMRPA